MMTVQQLEIAILSRLVDEVQIAMRLKTLLFLPNCCTLLSTADWITVTGGRELQSKNSNDRCRGTIRELAATGDLATVVLLLLRMGWIAKLSLFTKCLHQLTSWDGMRNWYCQGGGLGVKWFWVSLSQIRIRTGQSLDYFEGIGIKGSRLAGESESSEKVGKYELGDY
jgi:hypothetical protein